MLTRKSHKTFCKIAGTSLIELMIGQTLGLIVIAAALGLAAPAISGFATSNSLSKIQESGRIALAELDHAIRQSGYRGCNPNASRSNVVNSNHTALPESLANWAYRDYSIRGFNANEIDSIDSILGRAWQARRLQQADQFVGDLIMIRGTGGLELDVVYHDNHAQTISFKGDITDQLFMGQLLELNDCLQAATLQIDRRQNPVYDESRDVTIVQYGPDTTINCVAISTDTDGYFAGGDKVLLGGDPRASCVNEITRQYFSDYQFLSGTKAHLVTHTLYYIGSKDASGNSYLYRTGPAKNSTRIYTEAIVEGVENFRLLYGVDLDSNGTPDQYLSAGEINSNRENWSKLVSVRAWLMLSITTGYEQSTQGPTVSFPNHAGEMIPCEQTPQVEPEICPHSSPGEQNKKFYTRRVVQKEIYLRNAAL